MQLKQWIDIERSLNENYKRFSQHYPSYERGKNKQIRKDAEREIRGAMYSATRTIRSYPEISDLLTSDSTELGRAFAFDEFKDPRNFSHDMPEILSKIAAKIESLKSIKKE